LSLLVLLAGIYALVRYEVLALEGSLWGVSAWTWLVWSLAIPVAHHLYVLLCWRLQLHYGTLTRALGKAAFPLYRIGFFILFWGRVVFVIFLAIADQGTLPLGWIACYAIAAVMAIPALYASYSVLRYFGMDRAAGLDHFDPNARDLPFVRKGIFRFTSNAMYLVVFLLLYVPGLLAQSTAALAVALFSHAFIWVHYYCTELPDMKRIYGRTPLERDRR
jgi:hypothetical protein